MPVAWMATLAAMSAAAGLEVMALFPMGKVEVQNPRGVRSGKIAFPRYARPTAGTGGRIKHVFTRSREGRVRKS